MAGSSTRKRRRKMWQKGMLKKPRKHSGESNHSPASTSKADGANDSVCHSTPTMRHSTSDSKGEETAPPSELLNGYVTGATEDSADEAPDTPKKVLLDREVLTRVLEETVNVTAVKNNVERLVDLHGTLSRVIDTYLHKWDRTHLIEDLRGRLKKFEEDTSDEESFSFTVDGEAII